MSRARDFADLAGSADAGGITGRNLLINSAMAVAQRGTSVSSKTTSDYFTCDRWRTEASGATYNTSQQSMSSSDLSTTSISHFLRMEVTTGNNNSGIAQKIEASAVRNFKGKKFTASFYAKGTNPNGGNFSLSRFFFDGTNASVPEETDFTVTSSWQRFEITFDYPDEGSTDLTLNTALMSLTFKQPAGDTSTNAWTLDITGVQLELGEQATPFEHRSFGDTLLQCQRFFYKADHAVDGNYARVGHGTRVNQGMARCILALPVKMRATPTLSMVGTPRVEGSGASDISVIAGQTNKGPFAMGVDFTTANNGQPADGAVVVDLGASGEFSMDAEL